MGPGSIYLIERLLRAYRANRDVVLLSVRRRLCRAPCDPSHACLVARFSLKGRVCVAGRACVAALVAALLDATSATSAPKPRRPCALSPARSLTVASVSLFAGRAQAVVMRPNVISLEFEKSGVFAKGLKEGQYIFLLCPKLSHIQWHPFTLSSAPQVRFPCLCPSYPRDVSCACRAVCRHQAVVPSLRAHFAYLALWLSD